MFQILEKSMYNQVQEAQKTPSKINPKNIMPRHIIIKMLKIKNR